LFLKPSQRVHPDQWAARNRTYPESAGVPGPRDPDLTPYMIPFARAVASGRYARVVTVTAAQSGKTDTMLDIIGHRLDQRPGPILYVGPSKEFNVDQFEPRLMELLDQAPTLAAKVVRGRRMRQTLKTIAGVRVRLAHAGSSTALKSDPASLALIDEYDEMTNNVRGQGDVLGLVEARGDTYADFTAAITSTTSIGHAETEIDPVSGLEFWKPGDPAEIESRIWRLWQEGTRFHWAWPCPQCNEYFIPRMKCLQWPKDATPLQARRDARMICPCNGCVIDNDQKPWMNARGLMVAPGQRIENGRVIGAPPESSTCSFWTSGLASPFVTWGERAERLVSARQSGDPDRIQTAVNAQFGELFLPFDAGDLPSAEEIIARRLPYRTGEIMPEMLRLVAGVDVQKNCLYYVLRAFGGRGTSWLVNYGQIFGATSDDPVWLELTDLLLTPLGGLPIERMMIDSGYRPDKPDGGDIHKVYEFTRRFPQLVIPCKGQQTQATPIRFNEIEVTPRGRKSPISIRLAHLDTDFFKSLVHSRLRIPIDQPGAFHVPDDVTEDYARQLLSEVRTVTVGEKPRWVPIRRDNHFLDCESLAAAAAYMLNVQRIPEGVRREGTEITTVSIAPSDPPPDDDTPPPAPAPRPASPAGKSAAAFDIRSRFASRTAGIRTR
jgi:phage terminase large subunit GpA-like protein